MRLALRFSLVMAALFVVLSGTTVARAYPNYHPACGPAGTCPAGIEPPATSCTTCHVTSGGGGACGVAALYPCFNPFGYQYYSNASGWGGVSGSNADADNRSNTQEIVTDLTLAGFQNGAESVACDMGLCASAGSYTCSNNVICSSSTNAFTETGWLYPVGTARNRYTFSFSCALHTSGTLANGDSIWTDNCVDTNECSPNPCGVGSCAQRALAGWTSPGYDCSCPAGYGSNGTTCVVTNDCVANVDDCVGIASCSDLPGVGNFTCTCPPGYQGNGRSSGSGCTNINECAPVPCGPNGLVCTETPLGSWSSPGYSCTCQPGYAFNGTTCVLQNECTAGTDDCVAIAACIDPTAAPGDFTCTCPGGFVGNGRSSGSGCTDLNECVLGTDDCSVNGTCTNTPGSFACACNTGFSGDGRTCNDVDECLDPIFVAMCSGNATCNNLFGTFECNCNTGYTGTGFTCTDVNECAAGTDDCSTDATCTNTPGSWACACNAGFSGDGRTCTDIDECLDPALGGTCSTVSTCNNLPGSWECVCNAGFRGDGFTCADIDECAEMTDACAITATCNNNIGSYTCVCDSGYRGSGFTCTDIDECADGTSGCGLTETCVNQLGVPNICVCRLGYVRLDPSGPCVITCGDSVRGPGESCDDGNMASGDGCSDLCDIEPGWVCYEPTAGASVCDSTCGNGLLETIEECDDGAANSDTGVDACRTTCTLPACGDGVTDTGEECDDGAGNSDADPNGCRTTCNTAYCGDGVLDTGELCDPGGGLPGAALVGTCTTMCAMDAGVDPTDPPVLTGGACSAGRGVSDGGVPAWPLAALVGLGLAFLTRRKR